MGAGASRQCGAFWEDSNRQCKNIFGLAGDEEQIQQSTGNTAPGTIQPQVDEQGNPKIPEVAGAVEGEPIPGLPQEGAPVAAVAPAVKSAVQPQAQPQQSRQQQQQQQQRPQQQQQQQQQQQRTNQAKPTQPAPAQPLQSAQQAQAPAQVPQAHAESAEPGMEPGDPEPGAGGYEERLSGDESGSEYGGDAPAPRTKTPKAENLTTEQRVGLTAVANIFAGRPSDAGLDNRILTPAEQKKLTSFKVKSSDGAIWLFYKSSGNPVESRVRLDWEAAELSWDKPKSMLSSNNMRLREGFEVLPGKQTKVFTKKERKHVEDDLCLSIVTKKGSVDLQSYAPAQRDEWVWGLRQLLEDLSHRKDTSKKLWKSAGRLKALGRFGSPEVERRKLPEPGAYE